MGFDIIGVSIHLLFTSQLWSLQVYRGTGNVYTVLTETCLSAGKQV